MQTKKKDEEKDVTVLEVSEGRIDVCILGTTPLICNRMSEKARRELLLPRKKDKATLKSSIKHDPLAEFRASPYLSKGEDSPTRILFMAAGFKRAMASVAIDIPGATKAEIGRLTWVEGDYVGIYGTPQLHMSVVRMADINRTPDIRSRAILAKWAARLSVRFVRPILNEQTVVRLLAAAGIMRGVGDWRQEKGAGSYGQFKLVAKDDPEWVSVMKMGRADQDEALAHPECYDAETDELLSWYVTEIQRRENIKAAV